MRRRGRHGRRRVRGDQGIALLEAAIVTPLFFLLVFAVIDFGMMYKDRAAINSAASTGARLGSSSGSDPLADYYILQGMKKDLSALNRSQITRIVVFETTAFNGSATTNCKNGTPSSSDGAACNVYSSSDLDLPSSSFGCDSGDPDTYWCPTTRKTAITAASGGPPDYIGVWIKTRFTTFTKVIPSTDLTSQTIIREEPTKL